MDDGTLRRKTLLAVVTMGGGCALLLGLLGTASWLVSRASEPGTKATTTEQAPSAPPADAPSAPRKASTQI